MPWRARGPDGDRQAAASPPRSRSRRRSPPTRGGRSRPRRAINRRDECPSARRRARSVRSGRCSPSPQPRDSGANQGALFASQITARGPIVAPWNTPTVPIHQQPDPRKLRKCSEFLDSGEWAIQDSNLGPLPYQENLLSPPVVPTRSLIPANRGEGAQRKGTGGDWRGQAGGPIVAPRPRFEGTASYDPEADITPTIRSGPDAPEAGRCAPA